MRLKLRTARIIILFCAGLAGLALVSGQPQLPGKVYRLFVPSRSIADVLETYGTAAEARLRPWFDKADAVYPPEKLLFVAHKKESNLHVYVPAGKSWKHLRSYPVKATSGNAGPKLREGDLQVPEGIYRLEYLNPNSRYHLSMKINYPNAFDLAKSRLDKRANPGSDIFIHGKAVSIGCLAMGDGAIEELFVMTAKTGYRHVKVIITPQADMENARPGAQHPAWTAELYATLRNELKTLDLPPHD